MYKAGNTPITQETGKMLCLCRKCKNTKFARRETVWKPIVNRKFIPHYYIWFQHGEGDHGRNKTSSSSHFEDAGNSEQPGRLHTETSYHHEYRMVDSDRISDAFRETTQVATTEVDNVEESNLDAK